MDEVRNAVERFRALPRSEVDVGFLAAREKVVAQIREAGRTPDPVWLDGWAKEATEMLAMLQEKAKPHAIPETYLYFLGHYGGLYVDSDDYYFAVYGMGVMSEEWYMTVVSDNASPDWATERGFLLLGATHFRSGALKSHHLEYLLDLAGHVRKGSVIAVGPYREAARFVAVVEDIHRYPQAWRVVAGSFTEWLHGIAGTAGAFGYG